MDYATANLFRRNETLRLSCRFGELIVWLGPDSGPSLNTLSVWSVRDFWQMRDGDFVTITNRLSDLPCWVELHSTETAERAAIEMMQRLRDGYKPSDEMNGTNIWRIKAGDRLVWVTLNDHQQSVRSVLGFRACALAVGENSNASFEQLMFFGAPDQDESKQAAYTAALKTGFDAAVAIGAARLLATEWRFGA